MYESSDNPTFEAPVADAQNYELLVRALVDGETITEKFFWQPVFYPAYLFVVYLLTGSSIIAAKVLGVVLGAITCVLTYQLGRK
ncbi:MAG: hypothetical protein KJ749_14430, partial [Planctomycetes bacterium]|nr:hypothetical protein [Planctomycetota bacterium]